MARLDENKVARSLSHSILAVSFAGHNANMLQIKMVAVVALFSHCLYDDECMPVAMREISHKLVQYHLTAPEVLQVMIEVLGEAAFQIGSGQRALRLLGEIAGSFCAYTKASSQQAQEQLWDMLQKERRTVSSYFVHTETALGYYLYAARTFY